MHWDPIAATISKRYSSYKSQRKVFKLFLNFLPIGPHKTKFRIFKILKIEILLILFAFVNMGPNGSENFKTLLLQSQPKVFKLVLNFSPNGPHKTMFGFFEILSF